MIKNVTSKFLSKNGLILLVFVITVLAVSVSIATVNRVAAEDMEGEVPNAPSIGMDYVYAPNFVPNKGTSYVGIYHSTTVPEGSPAVTHHSYVLTEVDSGTTTTVDNAPYGYAMPYRIVLEDLKLNTAYKVVVYAHNAIGKSDPSNEITFTTPEHFNRPNISTVTQYDISSANLAIDTSVLHYDSVSYYTVSDLNNNFQTQDITPSDNKLLLTNLVPGTAYKFTIKAVGETDVESELSNSFTYTHNQTAEVVSIDSIYGGIAVKIKAIETLNSYPVDRFTVKIKYGYNAGYREQTTVLGDVERVDDEYFIIKYQYKDIFEQVTPASYQIDVRVQISQNSGRIYTTNGTVDIQPVLDNPIGVTASYRGDGLMELKFPTPEGLYVTTRYYRVLTYSVEDGRLVKTDDSLYGGAVDESNGNPTYNSVTVDYDFEPNKAYYFEAYRTNESGSLTSLEKVTSDEVTIINRPSIPSFTVEPFYNGFKFKFDPSVDDGGAPIVNYEARIYTPGTSSLSDDKIIKSVKIPANELNNDWYVISGLEENKQYTVWYLADNGTFTSHLQGVTKNTSTALSAPAFTTDGGFESLDVAIESPAQINGLNLHGFKIVLTEPNEEPTEHIFTLNQAVSMTEDTPNNTYTFNIPNLSSSAQYQLKVYTLINSGLNGQYIESKSVSNYTDAAPILGYPDAPDTVEVTNHEGNKALLVIQHPEQLGNGTLVGYRVAVTDNTDNESTSDEYPASSEIEKEIVLENLEAGHSYTFKVYTLVGSISNPVASQTAFSSTITVLGEPSDPIFNLVGKDSAIDIFITKPDAAERIIGYMVRCTGSSDCPSIKTYNIDELIEEDGKYKLTIASLTKNTAYTIAIIAKNENNLYSYFSSEKSKQVTVLGVPDAADIRDGVIPESLKSRTYDDGGVVGYSILVPITLPENTGGLDIEYVRVTSYMSSEQNGTFVQSGVPKVFAFSDYGQLAGSLYIYELKSLDPNMYYKYKVEIANSIGYSSESSMSSAYKTKGPASAPESVVATSIGNESVKLTITPSEELNGAVITGYEITEYKISDGQGVATGTVYPIEVDDLDENSYTISGLTLSEIYYYHVKTQSTINDIPTVTTQYTASNQVLVVNNPNQPYFTSALGFDDTITIKIENSLDTSITSYSYVIKAGQDEVRSNTINKVDFVRDEDSNIVIIEEGLDPMTNYTIEVIATNTVGNSSPATATAYTYARPTTPTISDVSLTDIGELTIAFSEPTSNGGEPITTYSLKLLKNNVEIDEIDLDLNDLIAGQTAGTYSYIMDGLEGEFYSFKLAASHQYGKSYYSEASTPVQVYVTPETPSSVTAVVYGNHAVAIDVTLGNIGGGEVAVYGVEVHDDEDWLQDLDRQVSPDQLVNGKIIIDGLEKNKNYVFKVWVKNNAPLEVKPGELGIWSDAAKVSNPVLVQGPPDAPTAVSATAGVRSATVSLTAPVNNGGSSITAYKVYNGDVEIVSSTTNTINVTNLANNTTYNLTVVAVNANGSSVAVSVPAFTTPAVPGPVTDLVLDTPKANNARVTISKVTESADYPVTDYEVKLIKDEQVIQTAHIDDLYYSESMETYSISFGGLTKNTSYTIEVRAINAVGASEVAYDTILVKGKPEAPDTVTLTAGNEQVTVSITAPTNDGGSAITEYEVVLYDEQDDEVDTKNLTVSGTVDTSEIFTGLTKNMSYKAAVVAKNAYGTSTDDTVSNSVIVYGKPDAPTNVTATAITNGATLTFDIPNSNSSPITSYIVTTQDNISKTFTTNSGDFTGLTAGGTYTFTVVAVNAAGQSVASDASNEITTLSPPSSGGGGSVVLPLPVDEIVTSDNGKLELEEGQEGQVSFEEEVTLSIPKGAFNNRLAVTVERLSNLTGIEFKDTTLISPVYELLKSMSDNFKEPITVSFKFNTADLKDNQVPAIFYYDEVKKEWILVGGTIKNGMVEAKVDHFTKFAVFAVDKEVEPEVEYSFSDINGHWAEADILRAVTLKIVTGYPDGTFKPKGTLTTSEFITMLVRTFDIEEGSEVNVADASTIPAWALPSFEKAVFAGIIQGGTTDKVNPTQAVTRAQLALYVARGLNLDLSKTATLNFKDSAEIPAWATSAIAHLNELGIIKGRVDGKFDADATLTRAEAITVILRLQAELEAKAEK